MADFMTSFKNSFIRSAKFIGRNTKRLTSAAKFKAHEMSDLHKRRKLIHNLGEKVYKLGSEGLVLPVELSEIIKEIILLDSDLNLVRSERAAQKAADAQLRAAEKAALAAEKAAAKTAATIEQSTAPVQIEIPDSTAETPVLDIPAKSEVNESAEIPSLKL